MSQSNSKRSLIARFISTIALSFCIVIPFCFAQNASTSRHYFSPQVYNDQHRFTAAKWYLSISVAGSFGSNANAAKVSSGRHLNLSGGYYLNQFISAGWGVGSDLYEVDEFTDLHFIPIFAEVRWRIPHLTLSPVISTAIGYGMKHKTVNSISDARHTGGIYINPKIGLQLRPHGLMDGIFIFTGYLWQNTILEQQDLNQSANLLRIENLRLQRINFGLGFLF